MRIVIVYAALLALLFVALSVRTLGMRRRLQVALGDGGDRALLRAMRVHANFAEYVPLALVLLVLVEGQGPAPALVHGLSLCLLAGRLSHAYGVSQVRENLRFRVFGMAMTFTAIIASAVYLLFVFGRNLLA
jgi:uncharacterized membrane protein YecN with MAPEG domain